MFDFIKKAYRKFKNRKTIYQVSVHPSVGFSTVWKVPVKILAGKKVKIDIKNTSKTTWTDIEGFYVYLNSQGDDPILITVKRN